MAYQVSANVFPPALVRSLFPHCLGLRGSCASWMRTSITNSWAVSSCLLIHLTGSLFRADTFYFYEVQLLSSSSLIAFCNLNPRLPPATSTTWCGNKDRQWALGHHFDGTDHTFQDLRGLWGSQEMDWLLLSLVTNWLPMVSQVQKRLKNDLFCFSGLRESMVTGAAHSNCQGAERDRAGLYHSSAFCPYNPRPLVPHPPT